MCGCTRTGARAPLSVQCLPTAGRVSARSSLPQPLTGKWQSSLRNAAASEGRSIPKCRQAKNATMRSPRRGPTYVAAASSSRTCSGEATTRGLISSVPWSMVGHDQLVTSSGFPASRFSATAVVEHVAQQPATPTEVVRGQRQTRPASAPGRREPGGRAFRSGAAQRSLTRQEDTIIVQRGGTMQLRMKLAAVGGAVALALAAGGARAGEQPHRGQQVRHRPGGRLRGGPRQGGRDRQ
jgi:hypothetical protein